MVRFTINQTNGGKKMKFLTIRFINSYLKRELDIVKLKTNESLKIGTRIIVEKNGDLKLAEIYSTNEITNISDIPKNVCNFTRIATKRDLHQQEKNEKDSEEDKEDEVQAGFKIGPLRRFFLKIVQFLKGRCKEGGRVHNLFSKAEGALIGSGAKVALSAAEKEAEKVDEKESEKTEKTEEKIDEEKMIEEIAIDGMEWIKENDERIFSTDHQWYMDLYKKTYTDFLTEFGDGKKPSKEGTNKAVEMADELELPKTSENSGKLGRVNDLLFFRVTKGVIEKAKSVKEISLTEKDGKAKSFGDIWEAYNKYDLNKRLANEGKKAAEAARAAKGKSKETPEAETSDKGETR